MDRGDGNECDIFCNDGYEPACQGISFTRSCQSQGFLTEPSCTDTGISSCYRLGPHFMPVSSLWSSQ